MAQLTETDWGVFMIISIVGVILCSILLVTMNWRVALIFFCILIGFLVAYFLSVYFGREEMESTCHYDLNDPNGCPDPNAYCTENFEKNYDNCIDWCYYDCPNNLYFPLGSNPGVCNEVTGKCDNDQDCTFPNLYSQPICLTVICDGELNEYFDGKREFITEDCLQYCETNTSMKCLQYYCSRQLNLDNAPECEKYCAEEEYEQTPVCIAYFCEFTDSAKEECVCFGEGGLQSDDCADFCKEENNIDTVAVCLQWLCEVDEPTNTRCLMPCTDFNDNLRNCNWIQYHNQEIYIQSVFNRQYVVTNVDSPVWQLTTLPREDYPERLPDIFRFFETDSGYAIFYFADEYSNNEMYGNEFFQIVNQRKDEDAKRPYNKFVLESTGIANVFYIKTQDLFQTGGGESMRPKYITLGCKGLVLEFYNSIREKQQWVIQTFRNRNL